MAGKYIIDGTLNITSNYKMIQSTIFIWKVWFTSTPSIWWNKLEVLVPRFNGTTWMKRPIDGSTLLLSKTYLTICWGLLSINLVWCHIHTLHGSSTRKRLYKSFVVISSLLCSFVYKPIFIYFEYSFEHPLLYILYYKTACELVCLWVK